jgi:hypothetical protein
MRKAVFIIGLLLTACLVYSQNVITIKKGESKTLSAFGGSGKLVKWYSGSCGGTLVGEGEKIKVSPSETSTYYGRWENDKKVSDCQEVTIIVEEEKPDVPPTPPEPPAPTPEPPAINIVVEIPAISSGESTILSYSGGEGKTFKWYSGSCGGTLVGEGNNLKVAPKTTTTYYCRWEDGDKVSDCQQITVTVKEQKLRGPGNTKTYSFGSYKGSLKNGIPEGDGTMTYTRHVQIAKHDKDKKLETVVRFAEAGDYFVGSWGNGDIVSGTLYNSSGIVKEKIVTSKRPEPYNIAND